MVGKSYVHTMQIILAPFFKSSSLNVRTRKLVTANRSHVSIWAGGVVTSQPSKNFLSSSLITMQNMVDVCHTMWAS